jgi:hypothetical protein
MVFSLRSPKLSGRPAETPKIPEIPEKRKRQMLTLSGDSGYFSGVSGPVLNLTASFLGLESPQIFRRFRNLTAQWLVFGDGYLYPSPLPFVVAEFFHEKHISTALRSSPHSRFARDLRREVSWG